MEGNQWQTWMLSQVLWVTRGESHRFWEPVMGREVMFELDLNRCVGRRWSGRERKEGAIGIGDSIALLPPPALTPPPLLRYPLQEPCSEIIQHSWGKRNKCSTLCHAKHTPPVLVPVKCISRLICCLNEMWKQFTPRLHLCCFTKQHRYSSIQSKEMRSVTPSSPWIESTLLFRSSPASEAPRQPGI